jgi:RNA polymerase sigma-70 factor (ECF subfamily)
VSDAQVQWLVDTYGALAYRVAYSIVGDAALAEDVVQECLVKAWTSMPSWDGDVPVRWLRRVVRNTAVSVVRRRSRVVFVDEIPDRPGTDTDVHRRVEGRAMVATMARALATLDDSSRALLVLRETDDMGYEEIAEVMDMTPSAVKAKLYRARHQLKAAMGEWNR